jgi:hypothetical protein
MSIKAAFSFAEYRQHPLNVRVPLAERFPGGSLSYISSGPGGLSLATVRLRPAGIVIEGTLTDPSAANLAPSLVAERWRRHTGGVPAFGPAPVILAVCNRLEWHLKTNVESSTQEEFIYHLRCEPQKILSGANNNLAYTGLLHEAAGLVFGVSAYELNAAAEAVQKARGRVVRRTVPALAVLNLLLADPRVTRHEMLPLVVDQGYAVTVILNGNAWHETQGQPFAGSATSDRDLAGLIQRIGQYDQTKRFLTAISPANCGLPVEDILRQAGAELTSFTINHVREEDVFAYASALF